jgi:hypothetical protein
MERISWLDRLGTVCKQYGPGRLPHAERYDVGAGYAGASAALAVAVLFALLAVVLETAGLLSVGDGGVFAWAAVVSLPIVVPAAFFAGTLVARLVPTNVPVAGAILGLLGTMGTYLGAFVVLFAAGIGVGFTTGADTLLLDAWYFAATFGYIGFLFTCWLTIPAGCASGIIYERIGYSA